MRLLIVLALVAFYVTVEAKPKENINGAVEPWTMEVVREAECSNPMTCYECEKLKCFATHLCKIGRPNYIYNPPELSDEDSFDQCEDKCQAKCCTGYPSGCLMKKDGPDSALVYCKCSSPRGTAFKMN